MASIKNFPKPEATTDPTDPLPPAASAAGVMQGKRLAFVSVRMSDELKRDLQDRARRQGTTLSNYLVHVAAHELPPQAQTGAIRCDEVGDLRRALDLVEQEDALTAMQKLWVLKRVTRFQARILEGKKAA